MAYVVPFPARLRYEIREKVKKPDGKWTANTIKVFHTIEEANLFVANDRQRNSIGRKVALSQGKVLFKDALTDYKNNVLMAPIPASGGGKYKGRGWTKSHASIYAVNKLLTFEALIDLELSEITKDNIDDYILSREDDDVSGSTINRELNILSPFFSWCKDTYKMRHWDNPVAGCNRPEHNDSRNRTLTKDEYTTVLEACAKSKNKILQYAFIISTATAIRRLELTKLKWSDVFIDGPDSPHMNLRKETTKTKRARAVPLSPVALKAFQDLREWIKVRKEREDYLRARREQEDVYDFEYVTCGLTATGLGQAFRRALATTNVKDFHYHDCRHCALTDLSTMYQALELSSISGHTDLKMLQLYYNPHGAKLADRMYNKA